MPPILQAPGFPPACPDWCPFDGWVVMAALMTDALIVTVILLALASLIAFLGQRSIARDLAPLPLVGVCALITMVCLKRLLQLDPQYVLSGLAEVVRSQEEKSRVIGN